MMQYEKLRTALGSVKSVLEEQDKEKKKKNALLEQLEAIDKKHGGGGLDLKMIDYDPPSDEELEEIARSALQGKYAKEREGIEEAVSKTYGALEKKKEELESSYGQQLQTIDDYYDGRKKDAEKDAVKRGLARSSVIMEQLEEFDRGKIDKKLGAEREIRERINEISDEIASLESQKEKALSEQDVLHAAELAAKIYQLKEDRDKKLIEALKYNNTVREKEKKYSDETKTSREVFEEKYAAAKSYFDGMSKSKAVEELLSNEEYKKHLGTYYGILLNYLTGKKGA